MCSLCNKRARFKKTIQKISEKSEEIGDMLKPYNRESRGRPRLETEQPQLLAPILDTVQANSAADARRRCEMLRTSGAALGISIDGFTSPQEFSCTLNCKGIPTPALEIHGFTSRGS